MKKIILFLGFILILSFSTTSFALARAGGGGGGGGGGSSSGGSRNRSSHYMDDDSQWLARKNSPLSFIFTGSIIFLISANKEILEISRTMILSKKTKEDLKKLSKEKHIFDHKILIKNLKKSFFIIENGWCKNDYSEAKNYMTTSLYTEHSTKISWMKIKKEQNIMDDLTLISLKIIELNENPFASSKILVRVKARATDYILNTSTGEVKKETIKGGAFIEYWEYILVDNKWLVNKIYQVDEIDLSTLKNRLTSIK